MAIFQHILWGYELTYPDDWFQDTIEDLSGLEAEAFGASAQALQPDSEGQRTGQLAVRAEWNPTRAEIEPLWERKIGMLASMMGAAKVGAAPWRLGNASGMEAEIVLPKRENTRLWTGILGYGFHVLQFMVSHPKEDRDWFEPLATQIISSLRFPERIAGLRTDPQGLPLPPGYTAADPKKLIEQISERDHWAGYAGDRPADALQAFYVREAPNHGWEIMEYRPFPQNAELGFARYHLEKAKNNGARRKKAMLGIMPYSATDVVNARSPANIVVRYD